MKNFRKLTALLLAAALTLGGCSAGNAGQSSSQENSSQESSMPGTTSTPAPTLITAEDETSVTFVDGLGKTQTIQKNPKRVVVAYNSLLDLWYLTGGEAVARVTTTENVPEAAQNLPEIGGFSSPNLELILSMEPDLVLLNAKTKNQAALIPQLEENNIPYIAADTKTDSFGSFWQYAQLYSALNGNGAGYEKELLPLYETCMELAAQGQAQPEKPSYAILYATTNSVTLDSRLSQTGQIFTLLGGENIVANDELPSPEAQQVPFSMETLVARDPHYLFITTMGDEVACKAYIEANIMNSSAWSELTAVKEGRIVYLDKELTIFKPNARYPEAFAYLGKALYPNVEWNWQ